MNEVVGDKQLLGQIDTVAAETEIGFFQAIKRLWSLGEERCLPAIVLEYDRTKKIASVLPLANHIYEDKDGNVEQKRPEVRVPVLQPSFGCYVVDFPLYRGNTGYLVSCDRSNGEIRKKNSVLLEKPIPADVDFREDTANKGPSAPDDFSAGEFKNGFFIPCSWSDNDKARDYGDNLVVKSLNGEVSIDILIGDTKWSFRKDNIYKNDKPFAPESGGMNLISGPDSNIKFSDAGNGKTYIDVYYK